METLTLPAFGQRIAELPPVLYRKVASTPLPQPHLVHLNRSLAEQLGLDPDWLAGDDAVALFTGNLPDALPTVATVYSGHQFGVWAGQLGDGRALLLGDLADQSGQRMELQLKGAGQTPFSRHADGRAVLRSSIREYLCSEAMVALGIPTTRALLLTGSPAPVYRETVETSAVVTRVSESFLRFGHFEHLYHRGDHEALTALADFALRHHFPEQADSANPYAALIGEVIARTARLIADWQAVGFCHGVMNTDNMSLLGLTIDYGPFGFLDGFDLAHICNHSDYAGRYAYNQQPQVALWNLHCLASTFLPLVSEEELVALLRGFQPQYETAYLAKMLAKLGLATQEEGDGALLEKLLMALHGNRVDYTIFFRRLAEFDAVDELNAPLRDLFIERDLFDGWAADYRARLARDGQALTERRAAMLAVNPKYVLRNHLAEQAIRQARDEGDFGEVDRLFRCLAQPFDEQPEFEAYAGFPPDWAGDLSVSCSS